MEHKPANVRLDMCLTQTERRVMVSGNEIIEYLNVLISFNENLNFSVVYEIIKRCF